MVGPSMIKEEFLICISLSSTWLVQLHIASEQGVAAATNEENSGREFASKERMKLLKRLEVEKGK